MLGFGWLTGVWAFFRGAASQAQIVRAAAPSLTSVIAIVLLAAGGFAGWKAATWWLSASIRSEVNAAWRAKLAAQNPRVKAVVDAGDAEGEAIDNDVIKEIGETYVQAKNAESRLATSRRSALDNRCSVPVECLRD